MKYVIDEKVCNKYKVTIEEVLIALLCKSDIHIEGLIEQMLEERKLKIINKEELDERFLPTQAFDSQICSILLESDPYVPSQERCENLASRLRELFPKGIKSGSAAWRGNVREITLKLQKFFKLYGNKWSDEEIIQATTNYINSFNGDYTYMRILKYFIMKHVTKISPEGANYIEEISELANWLEGDMSASTNENDDWLTELK